MSGEWTEARRPWCGVRWRENCVQYVFVFMAFSEVAGATVENRVLLAREARVMIIMAINRMWKLWKGKIRREDPGNSFCPEFSLIPGLNRLIAAQLTEIWTEPGAVAQETSSQLKSSIHRCLLKQKRQHLNNRIANRHKLEFIMIRDRIPWSPDMRRNERENQPNVASDESDVGTSKSRFVKWN